MEDGLVTPLRKRTLEGELYRRDANIEAKLVELENLTQDELRSAVSKPRRPQLCSERMSCLFRARQPFGEQQRGFERLYKILAERVLRSLPRAENADGKTASMTKTTIRDTVFWKIC